MAKGLRSTNAGTAREKAGREDLQQQLATATEFTFLAEDDVNGRGIERRGETISRVVFYFMPGERDRRFRFFLNDKGEVADFLAERSTPASTGVGCGRLTSSGWAGN